MLLLPPSTDWTWGSRPDPLWSPSLEGFEGRVVRHESWAECRVALVAEGRRVHDFYFHVVEGENLCDACGGTGGTTDYAEFLAGFTAEGGGRWAGWGEKPFPEGEFALLSEVLPGHVDTTSRTLVDHKSFDEEQETLVKETVAPLRAEALGIAVDCSSCGQDAWDELLVWSFGDRPDTGRIDVVRAVSEADHEDIRSFMGDAFRAIERRLIEAPGREGWAADEREFKSPGKAWFFDNVRTKFTAKVMEEFRADARNLIFDLHVVPTEPGRCDVRIWMTHPGRGYGREFYVENASERDADALARLLSDHYQLHKRNFGWALAAGPLDGGADDGRALLAQLIRKG